MKKYSIYIGILAVGFLLGWLIFGGAATSGQSHDHELTEADNTMWTCSMHPQIMQPEAGDCPICGMDLIPAETSAEGLAPDQFKLTKNAMALANVVTTIIGTSENSTAANTLILSGTVTTNDKATAMQTAHFGGRIEKLYYKSEGEFVKKGSIIASIYSPELVTAQSELIEALNIKNAQPELYKAVRNKLKYWKVSEQQIQTIERTKKVISNFNMYANTSGYIDAIFAEEGNHVKEGAPLFKVANLSSVWANFDVYEQDIKNLKIGQSITITLNAYSDKSIQAKINYIDPVLNTTTRTVAVRATLSNTKNLLKPGMLLSGIVQLATKDTSQSTISIPKTAVLWTGKRSVVYVKTSKDSPTFEMREIDLGNSMGVNYIVLSGLENGEEIVTNGTFTIDAAAQLQGKKSMMNPSGGKTTTGHEGHGNMQSSEMPETQENLSSNERIEVSADFQKQFKVAFNSYIQLKNALVTDNGDMVQDHANQLTKDLSEIDMKLLTTNNAHKQWMALEKDLTTSAGAIANTSDIKTQRHHFISLSNQIINGVDVFGVNEKVYTQFCPMANNNKGASWLSTEQIINNPYFGESMLKCGSVTKTIE